MLKFKKIYMALTAFLACAVLSVSILAVPETAAENEDSPVVSDEVSVSDGEAPPVIIGEDVTKPDILPVMTDVYDTNPDTDDPNPDTDSDTHSYTGDVGNSADTAPAEEIISPPYDPSSGELPPERNEVGEMFSGYEKGTGSIDNIRDYWEINGYPDYISFIGDHGVASYDVATQTETVYHLWEVGIADISEDKKEEVRSLISSEQRLFFTDCTYNLEARRQIKESIENAFPLAIVSLSPYSESIEVEIMRYTEDERDKVEAEILAMFDNDRRLIQVMIAVPTDGVPEIGAVVTGADNIGINASAPIAETREETAVASNVDIIPPIGAPDGDVPLDATVPATEVPRTEAAAAANNSDYDIGGMIGNMEEGVIAVDRAEGVVSNPEVSGAISEIGGVAAMISAESKRNETDSLWIWICAVVATAVVITAAVILGKRRAAKNIGLADGGEMTVGGKITKSEIVKAVKESEIIPDDKVFGEIMDKVKKD